ncbi:DNA ligase D [Aminobacter carboxidus]|uniref:DNA ligase (ATP) n=1 Tax=Aminobacter carboxidus TaxID=376165 RepID=A0ABR9GQR9_9HYPH|nr:DNA ligase D [Aminobacter carboxidus]MBE1205909.1 DNA ligase D [Aminobacter carboxidus]
MALDTYRKKRNFKATPEPRGRKARNSGHSFVVQKHDASRLHYDFRLELDGVLLSWAVTKGPSLVPGERRLAVHVEDHPLEYGGFEGTIPKGEYGGGTVLLWDRGTWAPAGDARRGLVKGRLDFELHGQKLSGRWHLVRMSGKPREKRENWLLIKGDDEVARSEADPDILDERPESVATGRDIADIATEALGWSSKTGKIEKKRASGRTPTGGTAPDKASPKLAALDGAKKASLLDFAPPSLATLMASAPSGNKWLHEIKFDGYRLQARVEAGKVRLLTRSGLDWTQKFGNKLISTFSTLPAHTALIDGELVVEAGNGASDFSALQADLSAGRTERFVYYAFDLLHLDGYDLRGASLLSRKGLLEKLIDGQTDMVRYSSHFEEDGDLVLRHACRLSLEGVVSKLKDAPYRGGRTRNWIKSKCSARQEFVVAGYVPSTTSSKAIGSLVLGAYRGGELKHVGRVGTGYTAAMASSLFKQLERIRIPSSPFAQRLSADEARQVRFVRPDLVAEVEFRAWTADGILRHASFRGLREDKPAADIVLERPKAVSEPKSPQRTVKLTHPDRLYWPDQGVTKEGLADYYAEIWRHIAPFVVGRPLALLRCPTGITGEKFFQKHAWKGINPNIVLVHDPKGPPGEQLISIRDLDGLMGLVQSAVLEIHPWGSTVADWERPDMIIMDLDPGDDVAWSTIVAAAEETKSRLEAAGLTSFVKTSGGKGLHVVAPLKPKAGWPAVKAFTKGIADAMAADSPDRYVATISKDKRKGKILIDYLRNQRGATAVAAFSTRARPGAAVSMPLGWTELDSTIGPAYFTVDNTPIRLASLAADPWADFRAAAVPLKASARGKAAS